MVDLIYIFKISILISIKLSAPILIVAIVSGVIISLIQTLFQIQDQTLPFTIKLISIIAVLSFSSSWIGSEMAMYFNLIFNSIPDVGT